MKRFLRSIGYAFDGIKHTMKTQINFVIQFIIFLIVILVGIYFKITKLEWVIIIFISGSVFSFELINTAVEVLVDLTTEEYDELAKKAKDAAAGAVLIMAVVSVIIGITIFYPYLLNFFLKLNF